MIAEFQRFPPTVDGSKPLSPQGLEGGESGLTGPVHQQCLPILCAGASGTDPCLKEGRRIARRHGADFTAVCEGITHDSPTVL